MELLPLNDRLQGMVVALLTGLANSVARNRLRLKGGRVGGSHLALLSPFFVDDEVSWTAAPRSQPTMAEPRGGVRQPEDRST